MYDVGTCSAALSARGLAGGCRRHACPRWRWGQDLPKTPLAGGGLWATVVALPGTGDSPPQSLRWLRRRQGRTVHALLSHVLEPTRLPAAEILALYPWRGKGARLFCDL